MDKKTLRNDIILIALLLLVMVIALVIVLATRQKDNLVATVSVQNEVVETIDLSKKEETDYYIEGLHGTVHIHTKDGYAFFGDSTSFSKGIIYKNTIFIVNIITLRMRSVYMDYPIKQTIQSYCL